MRKVIFQPHQQYRLLMLLGDLALIFASLLLVVIIDTYQKGGFYWGIPKFIFIYFLTSTITVSVLYIFNLYDLSKKRPSENLLISIFTGSVLIIIIYSALSYFIIVLRPGKINLILFTLIYNISIFVWHTLFPRFIKINPNRLLFIGREAIFDDLANIINNSYSRYYTIEGHWHSKSHNPTFHNLIEFVNKHNIDIVVYSVYSDVAKKHSNDLINIKFSQKNIIDAYNFYQRLTGKYPIYYLDDFWLMINAQRELFFPRVVNNLKRAFDLFFILLLLPPTLPVLLLAMLAIKLDSKGPVFFTQERLGQNEVPFRLIKLRTMIHDAEGATGPKWCTEDDARITKVGKVLRKLRIDELPQLFNILKGDMSLVGPRPIRQYFTEKLAEEIPFYKLRLLTKPGLTGWAQVNTGHAHTIEAHSEILQYDLFYLVHQFIWLDLLILFKTAKVMVWGKGT